MRRIHSLIIMIPIRMNKAAHLVVSPATVFRHAVCHKLYRNNHFSVFVGCFFSPSIFICLALGNSALYVSLCCVISVLLLVDGFLSVDETWMCMYIYGFVSRMSDIATNMIFIWITLVSWIIIGNEFD